MTEPQSTRAAAPAPTARELSERGLVLLAHILLFLQQKTEHEQMCGGREVLAHSGAERVSRQAEAASCECGLQQRRSGLSELCRWWMKRARVGKGD